MQRYADSLFLYEFLLDKVFGFPKHTTSNLGTRVTISRVQKTYALLSFLFCDVNFVLQISQLGSVLLGYLEKVVVLVGELDVLVVELVVIPPKPSEICLLERFPLDRVPRQLVEPFPLLLEKN